LTRLLAPSDSYGLAVFVDDLDRCSSAHVVEVVEAMNQIFNAARDHRVVFVLGLDRNVVTAYIEVAYADTIAALRRTNSPLGARFGDEFLAKLVQLSVAVPRPPHESIQALLTGVTGNLPPDASMPERLAEQRATRLEDPDWERSEAGANDRRAARVTDQEPPIRTAGARSEIVRLIRDSPDVIAAEFSALRCLEANPRQVKRFHNAFRLQLYIANEDERVLFDFGADQLHALGTLVAVRLRWPKLVEAIGCNHALLVCLEKAAAGDRVPDDERALLSDHESVWLGDREVLLALREHNPARRLSVLHLESFLSVA